METIAVRELRNQVSRVMAEVEAGESFLVSVSGRPVAELRPLRDRPHTAPGS
ncbi:MAG: type II toxin-antitoxin system prevent-host-death family antitoxin, partial [Acidimicrobiia bacterium]|nr:type II toxin-antitoxin system prevent-host-death family antitoxin [Acidimicrobiia bacterium]